MTQFADPVNIQSMSQLISDNSKVFQKLLKYFNDTYISTFPVLPLLVLLVNLYLNLNDSDFVMLSLGSSRGTTIDFLIFLYNIAILCNLPGYYSLR